jgi:hypothetical protein
MLTVERALAPQWQLQELSGLRSCPVEALRAVQSRLQAQECSGRIHC